MNKSVTVTLIAVFAPALAQAASSTECRYGDLLRRVVVLSEPGVSVPCEVHYYKDSEAPGEHEVLWRANSQAGYCEEQAAGLVSRLEGWGWDCGIGAPADAAEPAMPSEPAAPAEPAEPAEPAVPAEPAGVNVDDTEDMMPAADPEG